MFGARAQRLEVHGPNGIQQTLRIGDGSDPQVTIGPLTAPQGVEKAKAHIEDAVSKGAKVLLGGKPISGKGNFFEPTVIADTTPDVLLHNEEVFAPVAALYPFDSEEEAIKMANNLEVGLASCVCTIDIRRM